MIISAWPVLDTILVHLAKVSVRPEEGFVAMPEAFSGLSFLTKGTQPYNSHFSLVVLHCVILNQWPPSSRAL